MKKYLSLLFALLFSLMVIYPSSEVYAVTATDANAEKIVIASINDFHGAVLKEGKNPGIAVIAGELNNLKKQYKNVSFVSSGDEFQGTAISNLTKGAVVIDSFKKMGIKSSAIGNHEYDWGAQMMSKWTQDGGFPFLASNIVYKADGKPVKYAKLYDVVTYKLSNGKEVKVGFIGIATPETATKTLLENVSDVNFTDPVEAGNKWATYLRDVEKVDAVVALTHLGSFQDKESKAITGEAADFANKAKGIDLIFSAHTHQIVDGKVNGIQILQASSSGRGMAQGILSFDKESGKLTSVDGEYNNLTAKKDEITPDLEVAKIVSDYEAKLSPILNEVLGNNPTALSHNTNEDIVTPLGQWSAKKLAELGQTQIGYINGGGIRNPLDAGPITMGELYSIFPFDNTLVTMKISGMDLKNVIQHGITADGFRPGQFYGVNVYYNKETKKINSIKLLDGSVIKDDVMYTLSTLDFLYTGGDKYDFKKAKDVKDTFKPVRDLLAQDIRTNKGIKFSYEKNLFTSAASDSDKVTKPEITTKPTETKPSVPSKETTKPETKNKGKLPNTGDAQNAVLPLTGSAILVICFFVYLKKNDELKVNENK